VWGGWRKLRLLPFEPDGEVSDTGLATPVMNENDEQLVIESGAQIADGPLAGPAAAWRAAGENLVAFARSLVEAARQTFRYAFSWAGPDDKKS
jgi:hypothetical protein